jgi:putative FmdB family regulatory protein
VPIYEFGCLACRKRTQLFVRSVSSDVKAKCEHCGSKRVKRLISRVAVVRSEDDMFSGLDESAFADVDEHDPRSMARMVRKMSSQMGEPLDAETQAELERMEAGEMPDDFGDDDGGGDDGFGF